MRKSIKTKKIIVLLFSKTGGGAGFVRNFGLRIAKGKGLNKFINIYLTDLRKGEKLLRSLSDFFCKCKWKNK